MQTAAKYNDALHIYYRRCSLICQKDFADSRGIDSLLARGRQDATGAGDARHLVPSSAAAPHTRHWCYAGSRSRAMGGGWRRLVAE